MENKAKNTMENLLKDINYLELQNQMIKQKLKTLKNNSKIEEKRRNEYEIKIDELKQSTGFYESQVTKVTKILICKKKIYSQFELATQCYKRLIAVYEESLKPQNKLYLDDTDNIVENDGSDFQQEIEQCRINIQNNLDLVNTLLTF